MALKTYQTEVDTGKLYRAVKMPAVSGVSEQLAPNIQVVGNTIKIYGSQELDATPPTNMVLDEEGFEGIKPFAVIPNYLYFENDSGLPTSFIISGVELTEVE